MRALLCSQVDAILSRDEGERKIRAEKVSVRAQKRCAGACMLVC